MASQIETLTPDGARFVARRWIDGGGPKVDAIAPAGATVAEIVALAVPGMAEETRAAYVRVTIGDTVIDAAWWRRVRPKPQSVVMVRVAPGNSGVFRAVLSIAVGVAALALGQVWAAPLAGALGFGGSAIATSVAGGLITATTLLAGTLLVNSLVPLRNQNQGQVGGPSSSPSYQITGFRNVANPDGVIPCVLGKVRFAPPYACLPYTEIVGGETYVRAVFLLGYGPVKIRDIRLGDTPIEKYKNVEIETREGRSTDAPLSIVTRQVLEERLSVNLRVAVSTQFGPHTRFTASDVEEAEIDVSFPSGLFSMVTANNVSVPAQLSIGFKISYRLNGVGAWTELPELIWTAFSNRALTFSHRWQFPTRGRYEVRVVRTSADLDDLNGFVTGAQFVSTSIWSAIRSFRPEYPLNFPKPLALIAVRIKGQEQLNGVIDNLNAEVSREALDWDSGTQAWVTRETQNPASMLRYAMQGPAMAYPLDDADVDLENLQDFHEFCASKNLKFNRVIDYDASVYEVWSDIAAAGRAAPRDDGEKWGVVIDRPQTIAVQHITPRNSWDFAGTRDYVRFPDAFRVAFTDETNSHKQAERVVPWPGFVGEPVITESISFPGVTNPDQIWIEARRRQYELIYRRDTWTVMQDFEGALAQRGEMTRLSHDVVRNTMVAARVKAVDGNCVTLDSVVRMETGKAYAVRFRSLGATDDGPDLSVLRTVQTIEGETDTLFLSVPAGRVGDLAMFGEAGVETIECIVKEVEGAEDFARRFTLIPHAPEISDLTDAEDPPEWNGRVGESIINDLEWGAGNTLEWGAGNSLSWV